MMFDTEQFLNTAIETPFDTQAIPCPEGEWLAIVGDREDIKVRQGNTKEGNTYTSVNVTFQVLDEEALSQVGREKVMVRYSFLLEIDESGQLVQAPGANIGYGRLMDAYGINEQGHSISEIVGAGPVKVRVAHTHNEEKGATYANVIAISS